MTESGLIPYLGKVLKVERCDGSLRRVRSWYRTRGANADGARTFNVGARACVCDCETLAFLSLVEQHKNGVSLGGVLCNRGGR